MNPRPQTTRPPRQEQAPAPTPPTPEEQQRHQYILSQHELNLPMFTDDEVRLFVQTKAQVQEPSPGAGSAQEQSLGGVASAIERGDYTSAVNALLSEAQREMAKVAVGASNSEVIERRDGSRKAAKEWAAATRQFGDAMATLHAVRSLVDRVPRDAQVLYLAQIAQLLDNDRVARVAHLRTSQRREPDPVELAHFRIDEMRRGEKKRQKQLAKEMKKGRHPEIEPKKSLLRRVRENIIGINDPITPFGKSKVGYALGVGLGIVGRPVRLAMVPTLITSNIIWEKWARRKVRGSKTSEEYQKRLEKYRKSRRFIRGFTAGATAASLVGVFRPELLEAVVESKPWQMSESWLKWKGSTILGAPPSDFGLDAFGRPIEAVQTVYDVVDLPTSGVESATIGGGESMLEGLHSLGGPEVLIQSGDTLETLAKAHGVSGAQLYNPDYMQRVFLENYEIFKHGNMAGVEAFERHLVSNAPSDPGELRKLFFDAVRNIYPGQQITIPQP